MTFFHYDGRREFPSRTETTKTTKETFLSFILSFFPSLSFFFSSLFACGWPLRVLWTWLKRYRVSLAGVPQAGGCLFRTRPGMTGPRHVGRGFYWVFFLLSHKSVGMAARPRSRPHSLWLVAGVVTRPQWPMNYHEERRWTFFNSRRNGGENKRKNKQKTRSKGFRNERNGVSKRSLQNRWNRSHKFSFEVESVISLVKKNLVQHSIPERKAIHIIQETKIFC